MAYRNMLAAGLCLLINCGAWAGGTPQGTAFTYQGVLKSGGTPANGVFDLEFRLFEVSAGGTALGTVALADQTVSDGQFTVALDFGTSAFDGQERWLEIQVDATTLTPRQKVAATPYALFALAADGPNLTNLSASNLTSGVVPGAQLGGTYGNALTLNNATNIFAGTFAGSGAGLTSLDASNISSGTIAGGLLSGTYSNALTLSNVSNSFTGSGAGLTNLNAASIASGSLAAARLPTGGDWPLASTLTLDSSTLAVDRANNRVGIGTTTPSNSLSVIGNANFMGGVGIGTAAPGGDLEVRDTFGRYLKFAFGTVTINNSGTGTLMAFRFNDVQQGTITVSGTTVSYNGFMGSHYGWMDGEQTIDRGALVRMTGENRRLNGSPESDVVYGIEPTAIANDPACLGAYLGIMEPDKPADLANPHLIAAVGNGEMLVVDSGTGDIQPGDYLISADVAGCAMKDDSTRFPVGHVVARAAQRVDWSAVTPEANDRKVARVSVFFESFMRDRESQRGALRDDRDAEIESLRSRIDALEELLRNLAPSR